MSSSGSQISMTLHEAIEKLLREEGRPMTTADITDALNARGWFKKKDGSAICEFQIHGRTHSFPSIFDRDGSIVSLK